MINLDRGYGRGGQERIRKLVTEKNLTDDSPGIGISVHQGVDLELSFVEGVWRGLNHVAVHDLPDPRVQRHLLGGQYRNVVLVDEARLLLDRLRVGLLLQLLAGQPEEDVLFAVLATEKVSEYFATARTSHQSVETLSPAPDLIQGGPARGRKGWLG